jgi:hypothetical protein
MKTIRIIALAITLVMLLSAAACGNSNTPSGGTPTPSPTPSQSGTTEPTGTQEPTTTPDDSGGVDCNIIGCPHDGYGVYQYNNIWRYEGEWKDCKPNGQGTVFIDGSEQYQEITGNYIDGYADGTITVFMIMRDNNNDETTYSVDVVMGNSTVAEVEGVSVAHGKVSMVVNLRTWGMYPWNIGETPKTLPPTDYTPPTPTPTPDTSTTPGTTPTPDPTPTPGTSTGAPTPAEIAALLGTIFGSEPWYSLWDDLESGSQAHTLLGYSGHLSGAYIYDLGNVHRFDVYDKTINAFANVGVKHVDDRPQLVSGSYTVHMFGVEGVTYLFYKP